MALEAGLGLVVDAIGTRAVQGAGGISPPTERAGFFGSSMPSTSAIPGGLPDGAGGLRAKARADSYPFLL